MPDLPKIERIRAKEVAVGDAVWFHDNFWCVAAIEPAAQPGHLMLWFNACSEGTVKAPDAFVLRLAEPSSTEGERGA